MLVETESCCAWLVKRMPFCPIPHSFRDQFWLSVGLGLGLGLARYLRGLGRRSLSLRGRTTTLYYWPATGKAETIRMLLAEGGVPFEESFEKPDGAPIYAAGGEGMKAARTSAYFTACRSRDARRARTRVDPDARKVARVDHVLLLGVW